MPLNNPLLRSIHDQRGYLVLAEHRRLGIGHFVMQVGVRTENHGPLVPLDTSVTVTAETDHADFVEQARLMGDEGPFPESAPYYYRVVAE